MAELTAYELERQERIQRNQERMLALELPALAASLAPPAKPKAPPRGLTAKRKRPFGEAAEPRRRSARLQGEEADPAEIDSETRQGGITVVLRNGDGAFKTPLQSSQPAEPAQRFPKADIPFLSGNAGPASDAAFLRLLAAAATPCKTRADAKPAASALPKAAALTKLRLADLDVAKVTMKSVTHLAFMPVEDALVLAAADKGGQVGLWNVDYHAHHHQEVEDQQGEGGASEFAVANPKLRLKSSPLAPSPAAAATVKLAEDGFPQGAAEEEEEEEGFDGVLSLQTHQQYISGLKWAGGRLLTCSYDGSVRRLEAERGAFSLAWGDEDSEYSCFETTADGTTAFLGDNTGALDVVDLRAGKRAHSTRSVHAKKVNTVHLDPVGCHALVTASTDTTVKLWDVRSLGSAKSKPLAEAAHAKTCQAAYFAPDGSQRVVSTSMDDTVRVWDGKAGMAAVMKTHHDNRTGRWILPLRAVWAPGSDAVIIGNMKRYLDWINPKTGKMVAQVSSDNMSAIPARNCCHPTLPVYAASTGSGRVHVFR